MVRTRMMTVYTYEGGMNSLPVGLQQQMNRQPRLREFFPVSSLEEFEEMLRLIFNIQAPVKVKVVGLAVEAARHRSFLWFKLEYVPNEQGGRLSFEASEKQGLCLLIGVQ